MRPPASTYSLTPCREGTVELVGLACLQELKLHSKRSGRGLHVGYSERVARIGPVREDRHASGLGNGFPEQLQVFAENVHANAEGHPCDVPTRAREARDESLLNGIANARHDDRDS